jgi:hypothetical protein
MNYELGFLYFSFVDILIEASIFFSSILFVMIDLYSASFK